jgi:hypothetical protein
MRRTGTVQGRANFFSGCQRQAFIIALGGLRGERMTAQRRQDEGCVHLCFGMPLTWPSSLRSFWQLHLPYSEQQASHKRTDSILEVPVQRG